MKRWSLILIAVVGTSLAAPAGAQAGDAFVKFGYRLHPDVGDIGNRWFFSGGSDWGFRPNAFFGLEFQGAYHTSSFSGFDVQSVPANVLANVKWKSEAYDVRPYIGAGAGLVSAYVRSEHPLTSETRNQWVKDAGVQVMAGVEFRRKWAVEVLAQRVLEDGAEISWSILTGVRF